MTEDLEAAKSELSNAKQGSKGKIRERQSRLILPLSSYNGSQS